MMPFVRISRESPSWLETMTAYTASLASDRMYVIEFDPPIPHPIPGNYPNGMARFNTDRQRWQVWNQWTARWQVGVPTGGEIVARYDTTWCEPEAEY